MIMLNDLANDYDVDLIYYKYDYENDYIPERENVKVVMKRKNSIMIKLKNFTLYPFYIRYFLFDLIGLFCSRSEDFLGRTDIKLSFLITVVCLYMENI